MSHGQSKSVDIERRTATHQEWSCPECDTVIWVPVDSVGQRDHTERPFCGCSHEGTRMTRTQSKDITVTSLP